MSGFTRLRKYDLNDGGFHSYRGSYEHCFVCLISVSQQDFKKVDQVLGSQLEKMIVDEVASSILEAPIDSQVTTPVKGKSLENAKAETGFQAPEHRSKNLSFSNADSKSFRHVHSKHWLLEFRLMKENEFLIIAKGDSALKSGRPLREVENQEIQKIESDLRAAGIAILPIPELGLEFGYDED